MTIKKKYCYSNFNLIILFVLLLFFIRFSSAQTIITSSMTSDYEIVDITDDLSNEVSDLFGNQKIKSKFFEIIGKTGTIKLNYSVLEAKLNSNTGTIEGGLNLKVIKIFTGYEGSKKRNYVGFGGTYGVYDIRMELDFESGISAITGSTTTIHDETKYRIIIRNTANNNILLDYSGYTDSSKYSNIDNQYVSTDLEKNKVENKNNISLINGEKFNRINYSIFPITKDLLPRLPISIEITFFLNSTNDSNNLWRFGTNKITSQAHVLRGELKADFRNGETNKVVGNRALKCKISSGYHNVILRYNGYRCDLIVDGKVTDSEFGEIDITNFDGKIWVGRNGNAYKPYYLNGKVNLFRVIFE